MDKIQVYCPNCKNKIFIVRQTSNCPSCNYEFEEDVIKNTFAREETRLANSGTESFASGIESVSETIGQAGKAMSSCGSALMMLLFFMFLASILTMCAL